MHFHAYGLRELKLKGLKGMEDVPDNKVMEKLAEKCTNLKVLEVSVMYGLVDEVRDFFFTWASQVVQKCRVKM